MSAHAIRGKKFWDLSKDMQRRVLQVKTESEFKNKSLNYKKKS